MDDENLQIGKRYRPHTDEIYQLVISRQSCTAKAVFLRGGDGAESCIAAAGRNCGCEQSLPYGYGRLTCIQLPDPYQSVRGPIGPLWAGLTGRRLLLPTADTICKYYTVCQLNEM